MRHSEQGCPPALNAAQVGQFCCLSVYKADKSFRQPAHRPSAASGSWHNAQHSVCNRGNHMTKILMIHGWAANGGIFQPLRRRLPEHWQVSTPHLPGHGGNGREGGFSVEEAAERLAADIGEPAHILGWSLGGLVALRLAAAYPHKVRSLILCSTFARLHATADYPEGLRQTVLDKMVDLFRADYAKHMRQFLELQLLHTPERAEMTASVLSDLLRYGEPVLLEEALTAAKNADMRAVLPQIQQPVLLVYGDKDAVTPVRMGEYMARHLPDARLCVAAGAAHTPFLSHSRWFAAQMMGFIGGFQAA